MSQDRFVWIDKMLAEEPFARDGWEVGDVMPGWDPETSDANQFYTDLMADPDGNVPVPPPTP